MEAYGEGYVITAFLITEANVVVWFGLAESKKIIIIVGNYSTHSQ